ncbi:hypothetical protein ADM96_10105 [Burkholderia sp. ST111]|nr:hypothetical protein ADM96_10105 [Burkholderia sp. ST111]
MPPLLLRPIAAPQSIWPTPVLQRLMLRAERLPRMRHRLGIRLLIVVEPDTVSDRTHYAQSQRTCRCHTQRKTPESHRRRRSRRFSARIETRVRTLYGRF